MDLFNNNVLKSPTANDIMTYCPNQWVSAFNYRKVLDYRQANPNGSGIVAPAGVLMVSGGIVGGTLSLDPAFSLQAMPAKDDANGRYVIEGFSATNERLFAHRFSPYAVDDASSGAEAFVVAVPVSDAMQAMVARLSVREVRGARFSARVNTRGVGSVAESGNDVRTARLPGARVQMTFAPSRVPAVMVRDRTTGEVIALARNGSLDLSQFGAPEKLDLLISDGVKSTRATVDPISGALRK
jgi:hypothetical protein